MNYDASISTDVSLSKVLDEMILDGTDLEVVVSFLEGHEKQIGEIYQHSAYVYDLYDLAVHPYRINDFLVKHIEYLPGYDKCFAANMLMGLLIQEDYRPDIRNTLKKMIASDPEFSKFRSAGYRGGLQDDINVASGDVDFFKLVEVASNDERDVRYLLNQSYLARSMLMANNFLKFSTKAQFMVLKSIARSLNHTKPLVHATNDLLKQLLIANEVDMFNWVFNVLDVEYPCNEFNYALWEDMYGRCPKNLAATGPGKEMSFEETVFDMNMMETQFDVLDLFLYIYDHCPNRVKGMLEYPDLLEFFNLPFKWEGLDKLRKVGEMAREGGSYASEV